MKTNFLSLIVTMAILLGLQRISSAQDPCLTITTITDGVTNAFSLPAGTGYYNMNCSGANEEGTEIIYEYAATITGLHAIDVLSNNGTLQVALMYKETSGGCNGTGWTCVHGGFYSTPSFYISLTAGFSYYFMFDRTNSTSGVLNMSFKITPPGTVDPCITISNVPSCGTTMNGTLSYGLGFIDSQCFGGHEYGEEAIYTFTPTTSGLHALDVLTNNNGDVLLFAYKNAVKGCNSSGWTCLSETWGTPTYYIELKKDTTYYLLIDRRRDNTTTTSTFSFWFTCPGTIDPCTVITNVPSCGVTMNGSLGPGLGFIDSKCFGGHEYGEEAIFSFTPTMTGIHALDVLTNNNGDVLLYAYKNATKGCNSSGWTCIAEAWGTPSYYVELKKDTTYYFLIDKRRDYPNTSSTFSFRFICPGTIDPCTAITNVPSCGVTMNGNLGAGLGFIDSKCFGGHEYGEEVIYSFTPTVTGLHALDVLTNNNGDVLLFAYKNAAKGCNSTGWTCIAETWGTPIYYLDLKQDTTYYLLVDKRRDNPANSSTFTFRFTCPGTLDPCAVITPITTCNEVMYGTLGSGLGFINTQCFGGNEYGEEKIFSYTAPQTGTFSLDMLSNNNSDVLLFAWKTSSSGCSSEGWTCGQEFYGSPSFSLSLTKDTTYYFLFDSRRDGPNANLSWSFKISCPTTGDPCTDMIVAECGESFNISLTTGTGTLDVNCSGANEQGKEQIFSFTPPVTGLYGIGITSNNSGDALSLSFKKASGGCNNNDWECISNSFTSTPEFFKTLEGDTTYYFLFDRLYNNTTNTETFTAKFICQGATDPCTDIIPIYCNIDLADTLGTEIGYLNVSCAGSDEEGEEKIYSFTASVTGTHILDFLTNNNVDGISISIKDQSGGCDNTGWTCVVNSYTGTGNVNLSLTEGISYYLLFDRELSNQTTDEIYSFILNCPGPYVFNVTGGGNYCLGDPGLTVNLSGSEVGVDYQLRRNGTNFGSVVPGTGSPLSWSGLFYGTYTVYAVAVTGTIPMNGSAGISQYYQPNPSLSGPTSICDSPSPGNVYTTESGMTGYTWTVSSAGMITAGGTTSDHTATITWNGLGNEWVEVSYMGTHCPSTTKHYDVSVYPATDAGVVAGASTTYFGMEDTLILEGSVGSVKKWQKRYNGGSWQDIAETDTIYMEIPDTTGTWDYRAEVQSGNCTLLLSDYFTVSVLPVTRTIHLTLFLEGLYNTFTGYMNKAQDEFGDKFPGTVADQIHVRVAKPTAPFAICYHVYDINLNQNGTCTFDVPRAGYYYLVIQHRNSIQTWTSAPINAVSDPVWYNFSTSAWQAYGGNQLGISGKWMIYGGDENQDDVVDSNDMGDTDNDASGFVMGYVPTDVNGDGVVDTNDMGLIDNNSSAFIVALYP